MRRSICGPLTALRLNLLLIFAAMCCGHGAAGATRTTILVPLSDQPSWRDMAFLAAVPAACMANRGGPSLLAIEDSCVIGPEIADYGRRYRPDQVFQVSEAPPKSTLAGHAARPIQAGSAALAAIALSKEFWRSSRTAVVCEDDDYDSALIAAPLAALLKAPLFYNEHRRMPKGTVDELRRLGVRQVIEVGPPAGRPAGSLRQIVELGGANEIMTWVRRQGLPVRYLAAVNPLDRTQCVIKRLSLAGALLAAGRGGLVAPLRYRVEWKRPFEDAPLKAEVPAGVPKSAAPAKAGVLEIGTERYPFILTGSPREENLRLSIDLHGDGRFEAPLASGDTLRLRGKTYALSLGTRTGFGKTDVHLTWPTAERLCQDLRSYYHALGTPPDYLCLVGFPDAIPQAIVGHGGVVEEQASDLPYAFADEGRFAQIGVARVIAENAVFGTLYASRVLTYSALLSPDWDGRATEASWENTLTCSPKTGPFQT